MNTLSYFIFLACLLVLNIAVLYGYFLSCDIKTNETAHKDYTPLVLKQAYSVQAVCFLLGICTLFYFSNDKTWFYDSKFLYFPVLLLFFGLTGLLETGSRSAAVLCFLFEWIGITGFVFLLPDFPLLTQTALPAAAIRVLIGTGWFIVFKFFRLLSIRFEGLIVIQSLHIGFASLLVFLFLSYTPISLLQINIILLPIMVIMTPFYCVFHYILPLNNGMRNIFCLLLTGLAFFTVPAGNWGMGTLMIGYILFELAVTVFHFMFNPIKKQKLPLFFYDNLLEKTALKEETVRIIVYYNFLTVGLIFFMIYIQLQFQIILLAVFLYFKMYLNIMNPKTARTGVIDLFKEAKKTAKIGIKETSQAFSDLKKTYQVAKEKRNDEQP